MEDLKNFEDKEKIKDIVAQMPEETQQVDDIIEDVVSDVKEEKTLEDLAVGFDELPIFEPVDTINTNKVKDAPKSLNDKLKSGIHIGLNDKIAFIKHLFDGSSEDYERVLSQLNTSQSFEEAQNLIQTIIKPDYNHWEGKEEYEERFMHIIESKFN